MNDRSTYVVDSDVFITAKNSYYAFSLCPGFWRSVIAPAFTDRVVSIDRVRSELVVGRKTEDLVEWVNKEVPDSFFRSVDSGDVAAKYGEVMLWSQRHPKFSDVAKAKFASGADGWLVAYAAVHDSVVVTNEQPAPQSKSAIKIPDVCDAFGVAYTGTFQMLKNLEIKFEWGGG